MCKFCILKGIVASSKSWDVACLLEADLFVSFLCVEMSLLGTGGSFEAHACSTLKEQVFCIVVWSCELVKARVRRPRRLVRYYGGLIYFNERASERPCIIPELEPCNKRVGRPFLRRDITSLRVAVLPAWQPGLNNATRRFTCGCV